MTGTAVTFWVRDEIGEFTRILANGTGIGELADSSGEDLIAGHREQARAWEEKVDRLREEGRWVSMGRTRELYRADRLDWDEGVAGFYLVVESWDVPAPEADSLTVAGQISYIVSTGERFREVFDEIDMHETKIIPVGDYAVGPSDFNTIEYREPIERRVEVDRVIKVGL